MKVTAVQETERKDTAAAEGVDEGGFKWLHLVTVLSYTPAEDFGDM